jgi:hypothetical protein
MTVLLKYPITGNVGCCARTANVHPAAVPPTSVRKSRRLIMLDRFGSTLMQISTVPSPSIRGASAVLTARRVRLWHQTDMAGLIGDVRSRG